MSRLGITFNEVVEAAEVLLAQKENPTIDRVRALLDVGSNTTISNYAITPRQIKKY